MVEKKTAASKSASINVGRDVWNVVREGDRVRLERTKGGAVLTTAVFDAQALFAALDAVRG